MDRRLIVPFFGVALLFSQAAQAAQYEIKKGEVVSAIVLKLTGSPNFRKDGIKVLTDKGRQVSRTRFDHVRPHWMVVIDDKHVKTVKVEKSAGKTLAQVCVGSTDPRCAHKLGKLNGIITSRTSKRTVASRLAEKLTGDVYALKGMVTALAVTNPVLSSAPTTPKTATAPSAPSSAQAQEKPTADLAADPSSIYIGQTTTVTWSTSNNTKSAILNGYDQKLQGSMVDKPEATKTYTLSVMSVSGFTIVKTVEVTVRPQPWYKRLFG